MTNAPNPKYRLQGLMLASFLFIADQAVKFIMIGPLALQSRRQIHIISFFDLTWAENRGVSMGFLEANSEAQRNIVDRVRYGYVVDYADLHFGNFRPFWIFNLADACITIGVLILLARAFLIREKADNKEPTVHPASSGDGIAE